MTNSLSNVLLESLPTDLHEKLAADLDIVSLPSSQVLTEEGAVVEYVYFPTTCLISVVVALEDGNTVEASTIGRDGFSGISAVLGTPVAINKAIVQVPGEALRMPIALFMDHLVDDRLRSRLGAYAAYTMAVIAQSSACLAFHSVNARLARWLLMVRDGTGRDEFPLTQEFMGNMIGAQRPTVTIAVRTLQVAGLIENRRGLIRIVDRAGLETAACECYTVVRNRQLWPSS